MYCRFIDSRCISCITSLLERKAGSLIVVRNDGNRKHLVPNHDSFEKVSSEKYTSAKKVSSFGKNTKLASMDSKKLVDTERPVFNGEHTVAALATARAYDMTRLKEAIIKKCFYLPYNLIHYRGLTNDVMYFEVAYDMDFEERFMFFFRNGAIVCWNMTQSEISSLLPYIRLYEVQSYRKFLIYYESEAISYNYSKQKGRKTVFEKGRVILEPDLSRKELTQTTFSVSNALALSVKLGIWESNLKTLISYTGDLNEALKRKSSLKIRRRKVLENLWELYSLRNDINLSSGLLGTPDFFWGKSYYENLFNDVKKYYDIDSRFKVINMKIDLCLDLLKLVLSQLNDSRHVRLEYTIIFLIAAELMIELLKLLSIIDSIINAISL